MAIGNKMLGKLAYLSNLRFQKEVSRLKKIIQVQGIELKDAKQDLINARSRNTKLHNKVEKNFRDNEVLLEKYYVLRQMVAHFKYEVLVDYQKIESGVDDLELLKIKNTKMMKKIDKNKYKVM